MPTISTPTFNVGGPLTATTGTFSGAVSMTALTATTGAFSSNVTVGGTATVTGLAIVGSSFNANISGGAAGASASFGANYYNNGAARVRPDTGKAGLMWEFDATDSVYLQYITAAGVASIPFRVTTAGAVTTNGGLQTFGANDSAGAGFRLVKVPNV